MGYPKIFFLRVFLLFFKKKVASEEAEVSEGTFGPPKERASGEVKDYDTNPKECTHFLR